MTLLNKIQIEKITSKNTNRTIRYTNADKTTVLLSRLRNNYSMLLLWDTVDSLRIARICSTTVPYFDQVQ